jgi:hypothetical protein
MGFLGNLKATAVQRTADKDVVTLRRNKFANQVQQQLAMLAASATNTPYTATKLVQVVDSETGTTVQKEVAKRVKQWHFEKNGKLYMQFYYGNKVLAISKKGNAVECANKQDLERLLKDALVAIDNAEFDECIAAVSKATRAAFTK